MTIKMAPLHLSKSHSDITMTGDSSCAVDCYSLPNLSKDSEAPPKRHSQAQVGQRWLCLDYTLLSKLLPRWPASSPAMSPH